MRRMCYRCWKREDMCLCARIPRVEHRTPILILQHAHERHHAIGTARFARLGLSEARVEVLHHSLRSGYRRELTVPEGAALLFPRPGARRLDELDEDERPSSLVVLDGTWGQARRLYRENAWLHELPHVVLAPRQESRYRIRREPRPDYVSTLEAVLEALHILEGPLDGHAALLEAFDAMIDAQIEKSRGSERSPRTRRRGLRRIAALPRDCIERAEDVVLLYCESVQKRLRRDPKRGEVLECRARRPQRGEELRMVLAQERAPSDEHLARIGLPRADVDAGLDREAARARWRAFVQPSDILLSWNAHVPALVAHTLGAELLPERQLHAKSICSGLRGGSPGSLESSLELLGLEVPAAPSRAAARLAQLEALWSALTDPDWRAVLARLRA